MEILGTPNALRVWICEECDHIFADEEIRKDASKGLWGHACKSHPCRKGQRCESYLTPHLPEPCPTPDKAEGGYFFVGDGADKIGEAIERKLKGRKP